MSRDLFPEVRAITSAQTLPLRLAILRAGMPPESAVFPGDELASTQHFGAFCNRSLVGVTSIYAAPLPERPFVERAWQLRGMAVVPEMRGLGFGRALLEACTNAAKQKEAGLLWCNARIGAVEFYARHGWKTCSAEFDIPTAGPHYRMFRELHP